jgi:ribonuclease D
MRESPEKEKDEKTEGGTVSLDSYEFVTDPDRLSEVAALLKRLLSIAAKADTYIVDCQRSVDPAGVFPILAGVTVVAHNALFDLSFLPYLGFVTGNVADTMILSQLLHAGSKVEPLKRGQTSHSLDSVVKRELGLELNKTHQSSDWGDTLAPGMVECAA